MSKPILAAAAVLALGAPLSAQHTINAVAGGAVLYERYSFDGGLPYSSVSELTVPVTIDLALSRWGNLTVSGGYVSVSVKSADAGEFEDQTVSGILDTEARLSLNLIPDRLALIAVGSIPTGVETLEVEEQQALALITTEVLGFSATTLGTGGNVGGGFAGAIPAGRLALGFAGSYTHSVAYQPVLGSEQEVKPGNELRLRAGLEGTVGSRTYLRAAGIFSGRQSDELEGEEGHGAGNRYSGYFSVDQGLGATSLTLYAFDSYRSKPRIEPTAVGSAILPKGNVLALGAQLAIPVARETRLTPRFEFRRSDRAPDPEEGGLERVGSSFRFGADLSHPISRSLDLVLEATALVGEVVEDGEGVGVSGFRVGVHLHPHR